MPTARLEAEGLVAPSPSRGVVVRGLTWQDFEDIYEIRGVLEPLAARRAATRISAEALEELRRHLEVGEFHASRKRFKDAEAENTSFSRSSIRRAATPGCGRCSSVSATTSTSRRCTRNTGPARRPTKPFGMNDYIQVFTSRWPGGRHWERLLEVMGRTDLIGDERYAAPQARFERRDEVNALVIDWTSQHTKFEAMQILGAAGIPASAVFDASDLANDAYLKERGMVVSYDHPVRGTVTMPKLPIQMSASTVAVQRAPLLGEHNRAIYRDMLGMPETELKGLEAAGAI